MQDIEAGIAVVSTLGCEDSTGGRVYSGELSGGEETAWEYKANGLEVYGLIEHKCGS